MSTSPVLTEERPAADIEKKIKDIDQRLTDLRGQRQKAEVEVTRLTREESRLIRNYAEAIGREKHELRGEIDSVAEQRTDHEREMAGLAVAIAEAEQERTALLPEYEREWRLRSAQGRKKKLDELRKEHDKNLEKVRECDKALLDARVAAERSFFAWTTFKDQEAVNEQLAAQEVLKAEWQKNSGPNAPGNRS